MTLKIRDLELGEKPRAVGVVDTPMPVDRLREHADRGVDIFEMRVDLFKPPFHVASDGALVRTVFENMLYDYFPRVRQALPCPLICTVRENDFTRGRRIKWYVDLAKHADIVDIELGMPEWREVVDGIAGAAVVMVSEHDYNGTPDMQGLREIARRAADQGARIVKIAVTANSLSDVRRLLRFTEECELPAVTMAMGGIGKISRVAAPLFGSLLTYGYLRRAVAPGQMPAAKLVKALGDFYMA